MAADKRNTSAWRQWQQKFDARQPRERLLLGVMALAIVLFAMNLFVLHPLQQKHAVQLQAINAQQDRLHQLNTQLAALQSAQKIDPDQELRARLMQLGLQEQELSRRLDAAQSGLVRAEQMPDLLESILRQQGRLDLVSLKTMPVEPVVDAADAAIKDKAALALLYRHAVELEVRGSYFDLVQYLQSLENGKWHFYWRNLDVDTEEYPLLRMRLIVQTYSLDRSWLSFGKNG